MEIILKGILRVEVEGFYPPAWIPKPQPEHAEDKHRSGSNTREKRQQDFDNIP